MKTTSRHIYVYNVLQKLTLLENVAECSPKVKFGSKHKDVTPRRSHAQVAGDCLQTVELRRRKVDAKETAPLQNLIPAPYSKFGHLGKQLLSKNFKLKNHKKV